MTVFSFSRDAILRVRRLQMSLVWRLRGLVLSLVLLRIVHLGRRRQRAALRGHNPRWLRVRVSAGCEVSGPRLLRAARPVGTTLFLQNGGDDFHRTNSALANSFDDFQLDHIPELQCFAFSVTDSGVTLHHSEIRSMCRHMSSASVPERTDIVATYYGMP